MAIYVSGINVAITDLGGYRGTMTDATSGVACAMTDAPTVLPSVAMQASLGLSAGAAMGLAAIRPARVAALGLSASAAVVFSPDVAPAAAALALGAWIPPVGPVWSHNHAANYQALVGKAPAIIHWYQDVGNSPTWNRYGDISLVPAGVIPLITYELWDYKAGAVQATYTNAAISGGAHDAAITAFATAAAAWGKPFFFRLMHEGTYRSYPWAAGPGNGNGNSGTSYINAWRHVWQLFRNAGATNAKFVFCPSVTLPGADTMAHIYPGTSYVDWLGLDGYSWPTPPGYNYGWRPFGPTFQAGYDEITALGPQPLLIGETGCSEIGGDKAAWIANMGSVAPTLFPRLRAVVWFSNNTLGDWQIDTSPASLAAFRAVAALPAMAGVVIP